MKTEEEKAISKLFANYYKAEDALIDMRDKLYPAGTKVRSRLTSTEATVKCGSLYAHQVFTDALHMGWRDLEIITEPGDGT